MPRSTARQNAITMLQEAEPPFIPEGAHVMAVVAEFPPGDVIHYSRRAGADYSSVQVKDMVDDVPSSERLERRARWRQDDQSCCCAWPTSW